MGCTTEQNIIDVLEILSWDVGPVSQSLSADGALAGCLPTALCLSSNKATRVGCNKPETLPELRQTQFRMELVHGLLFLDAVAREHLPKVTCHSIPLPLKQRTESLLQYPWL